MAQNNAKLPDVTTLVQAGIDPRTGLPLKYTIGDKKHLKDDIKKFLRLIDEQDGIQLGEHH